MKKSTLDGWAIVFVLVLVLSTIDLAEEIFWLTQIHTVTVVSEIVAVFCFYLVCRGYRRLRRGDNICVVEDLIRDGERTICASEFWVGSWWSPVFFSLSIVVNKEGKALWVLRLRTKNNTIGELRDEAELIFKSAEEELMEIYNVKTRKTKTEYEKLSYAKIRRGQYPMNMEILDAFCDKDIVKIRVINELSPLDLNIKGQNFSNLIRISRNVIEEDLVIEKTLYSGM